MIQTADLVELFLVVARSYYDRDGRVEPVVAGMRREIEPAAVVQIDRRANDIGAALTEVAGVLVAFGYRYIVTVAEAWHSVIEGDEELLDQVRRGDHDRLREENLRVEPERVVVVSAYDTEDLANSYASSIVLATGEVDFDGEGLGYGPQGERMRIALGPHDPPEGQTLLDALAGLAFGAILVE